MTPTIKSINGPVIKARNASDLKIREMVTVGKLKLIGEVVSIDGDYAIIQVYEDTSGLKINDEIIKTNRPLSVRLGPGMIGNMFDGIIHFFCFKIKQFLVRFFYTQYQFFIIFR